MHLGTAWHQAPIVLTTTFSLRTGGSQAGSYGLVHRESCCGSLKSGLLDVSHLDPILDLPPLPSTLFPGAPSLSAAVPIAKMMRSNQMAALAEVEGGTSISSRGAIKAKHAIPAPPLQCCCHLRMRNKGTKYADISNCDGGSYCQIPSQP